jgi:hypothetical protein
LYAPSGLTADLVSHTQAVVQWHDNSYDDGVGGVNEDAFVVERYDSFHGWQTVDVTGPDVESIVDSGLAPDTTYYYRVSAFESSEGYSSYSNEDYVTTPDTIPFAPTNLTATAVRSSSVTLSWFDRSANEDGFNVYRAEAGGQYALYDRVGPNTATYTDFFVDPGNTYFYFVTAYDNGGESSSTNAIQVDTPETVPNGASGLSLTVNGPRAVRLVWSDNSDAEQGFRIERSTNGGAFRPIGTVGANVQSYVDNSALPDTQYGYRIVAFNGYGDATAAPSGTVRTPIEPFTSLALAKDVYAVTVPSSNGAILKAYDRADGKLVFTDYAFPGFGGDVRIAVADVNGDGVADIVAAAGPGGGPHVKVFNGMDGSLLYSFYAFDAAFTGGVFVAAGDVDHDGKADIVVGADAGGGPHVKAFSGATGATIRSFFAYDAQFAGGVRVAVGDVDGDGYGDIVTGAGAGGGPHVKVFSGKDGAVLESFYAFDGNVNVGVYVGAGDLDGDGKADVVAAAGGIAPHVKAFKGTDASTVLMSFYAYDPRFAGGVRVAVSEGSDGRGPIVITAPGKGGGPHVRGFRPLGGGILDPSINFFAADADQTNGVYVGAAP